jgi:phage terminase large subunit-like protein
MTTAEIQAVESTNNFIGSLKHVHGKWRGVQFDQIPWQKNAVNDIFGNLKDNGKRQIKTAYIEIPKKQGKSTWAAAIGIKMLCADGEWGAEVYGCAADRGQASIVFNTAVSMIEQDLELSKLCKIIKSLKRIIYLPTDSFYQVLSAEAFTKHGLNPSCVIFDELHAQKNREFWDVMTVGSTDAREQPLILVITTAGDDPDRTSIGWEMHEKAMRYLAGECEDKTFFAVVYGMGDESEWKDPDEWRKEENWIQANPAIGHIMTLDRIREHYQSCLGNPAEERKFKWLRLNVWNCNKQIGWLQQSVWDKAVHKSKLGDLAYKECYGGLDLSSTTDLTAMALFFPNVYGDRKHFTKIWYWIPEDNIIERELRDKVPYRVWVERGYIETTPGNVVDYDYIETRAMDIIKKYTLKQMGFDRRFATQPVIHMMQAGIECVEVAQTMKEQTMPINEIEILVKNEQILHDKNPVTRWCLGNVRLKVDENDNKKFIKIRNVGRMDGMAALSNAVDRWMRDNNDEADLSKMISFVGG